MAFLQANAPLICLWGYLPLESRDVLGDLSDVGTVVHKEKLDILLVSKEEFPEAAGEHVTGLLVLLVADLGHFGVTSESTSNPRVNTSGLAP